MNGFEVSRRIGYYIDGYIHLNFGTSSANVHFDEDEFLEFRDNLLGSFTKRLDKNEFSILLTVEEIERRIKVRLNQNNIELKLPDRKFNDDEYFWILDKVLKKEQKIQEIAIKKKCILKLNVGENHG